VLCGPDHAPRSIHPIAVLQVLQQPAV
jgi:hypothetical protein